MAMLNEEGVRENCQSQIHHSRRPASERNLLTKASHLLIGLLLGALCSACRNWPDQRQRANSLQLLNMSEVKQAAVVEKIRSSTVYLERWKVGSITESSGVPIAGAGAGAGVILTNDGYVLTAAHCLSLEAKEWQFVAMPNAPQTLQLVTIHRVWVGDAKHAEQDLALIKLSFDGLTPFQWCDESDIKFGSVVLAAGSHTTDADHYITVCAGNIRDCKIGPKSTIPTAALIVIDAPMGPGDSGGPVSTIDGKLIGITRDSAVTVVRPSPEWISQRINEDRRNYSATQPTFKLNFRRDKGPGSGRKVP